MATAFGLSPWTQTVSGETETISPVLALISPALIMRSTRSEAIDGIVDHRSLKTARGECAVRLVSPVGIDLKGDRQADRLPAR